MHQNRLIKADRRLNKPRRAPTGTWTTLNNLLYRMPVAFILPCPCPCPARIVIVSKRGTARRPCRRKNQAWDRLGRLSQTAPCTAHYGGLSWRVKVDESHP
ncbi:hypothetical protein J3458_004614 [Metarhizium acridum]|uniref:uncharacterized protein n=1 Tax=Metarhizium acridum TaxID=92637 RepID=UPI001C6CB354|nr:hypothetical protein J3458_004614 [Metarhizium acridum]